MCLSLKIWILCFSKMENSMGLNIDKLMKIKWWLNKPSCWIICRYSGRILCMEARAERENRIRNDRIGRYLNVDSVKEAVRRSRLRRFSHIRRMNNSRLPKRWLSDGVDRIWSRGSPQWQYLNSVRCDLNMKEYERIRISPDIIDSIYDETP